MRSDRIPALALVGAWLLAASLTALAQGLLDDLVVAVTNDRADAVQRLLARGMDPNSVDANGDTLLCRAARNGSARTVELLVAAKAKPNTPTRFGDTPLMLAALQGNFDSVRALVAGGAEINPRGWCIGSSSAARKVWLPSSSTTVASSSRRRRSAAKKCPGLTRPPES